jgi:hypothetical protein
LQILDLWGIHFHAVVVFGLGYNFLFKSANFTMFESENEWQKIEQVPIPPPRASWNFPDVKTRNEKKSINRLLKTGPIDCFELSKVAFFIVI